MTVSEEEAQRLLAIIRTATDIIEEQRASRLEAIRTAAAAGIPITHIARSADISREYVYRLLRDS